MLNSGVFTISLDLGFVFILSILASALLLSFIDYAASTTRVFGLLLLSAAVVVLWASQTYFMLIYLVYILAFISAVLMLFIGVVLMLPLSLPARHRRNE